MNLVKHWPIGLLGATVLFFISWSIWLRFNQKIRRKLAKIACLGIILPLFILLLWQITPEWIKKLPFDGDMQKNIIAEVFGILITVFIIDRLIKQREERRLLAPKQIVHARFLLIIDHLLEDMSKLFPGDYSKPSENLYIYGTTPVYSKIRFDDLSTLHSSILTVQENIEQHINIQKSSDHNNKARYNIYRNTPLSSTSDQVNQIFSGSILLIEPELSKLLNKFFLDCENLKYAADIAERSPIPYDERWERISNTVFVEYIKKSMTTAIEIREWLIVKADSHFTS